MRPIYSTPGVCCSICESKAPTARYGWCRVCLAGYMRAYRAGTSAGYAPRRREQLAAEREAAARLAPTG